jgi:hypothetical protein
MQKRSRHDQIDKHKQKHRKRHNKEELDDAVRAEKILRQHHEMTFESSDSISVEKLSDHQAVASRRFTVSLWIRLVIKNL